MDTQGLRLECLKIASSSFLAKAGNAKELVEEASRLEEYVSGATPPPPCSTDDKG